MYNLQDVNFFGHGGSFSTVKDVIIYKNKGLKENSEVHLNMLSPMFVPLGLSELEIDQLTAFIENALYDTNLSRYVPKGLPTGNCFPDADSQSSIDMGCN